MTRTEELELWTTKVGKCAVTPQVMCPIAKSFVKRGEPKVPTAVRSPLGVTDHTNEKAKAIAYYLEKPVHSS
jgi:hypothetical protein